MQTSNRAEAAQGSAATVASGPRPVRGEDAADLVRAYFAAFHARDRDSMERLLGERFTFTSPFDDRIDKAAYFQRCWPLAYSPREFTIESLCAYGGEAFVRYQCAIATGPSFRNLEYFRIEGGRITEVEVYFGSLPGEAA